MIQLHLVAVAAWPCGMSILCVVWVFLLFLQNYITVTLKQILYDFSISTKMNWTVSIIAVENGIAHVVVIAVDIGLVVIVVDIGLVVIVVEIAELFSFSGLV